MTMNLQDILLRHWLFGCLPRGEITSLSHQFSSQQYSKGAYIFHQNDPADSLFIIIKGQVSIETVNPDGKLTAIAQLSAGDVFGEFALIDHLGRSASARIAKDSVVASLAGIVFKRLLRDHAEFNETLMKALVTKVRTVNQHIESLITLNLLQRTARILLTLSDNGETEIKITQSELGALLHASREKVNSKLKEIEKVGAIDCGRGKVLILNQAQLVKLSEFV